MPLSLAGLLSVRPCNLSVHRRDWRGKLLGEENCFVDIHHITFLLLKRGLQVFSSSELVDCRLAPNALTATNNVADLAEFAEPKLRAKVIS